MLAKPNDADETANAACACFRFTLEACAASCGRVQSLKLILAKRTPLLLPCVALCLLQRTDEAICMVSHGNQPGSSLSVHHVRTPPCAAGQALHPGANQAQELAPAVSGAVDVPGLPFVAEQGSKGISVLRQPSPAQPAAPQDTCAVLRQRLGLPQPWPLQSAHLACVGLLLRAGAGLKPRQWQCVQAACKQLQEQQVRALC